MTGLPVHLGLHRRLRQLGTHRTNPAVKAVAGLATVFLDGYGVGAPPDPDRHVIGSNGEAAVLQRLGSELGTVLDVGANVGEWTAAALAAGARRVHAFEISPSTRATLQARHGRDDRVTIHPFGLSDADGALTIRHYPHDPRLTTTTAYPHGHDFEEVEVPVRPLDAVLDELGLDVVDYLKLDVEGAEPNVLRGSAAALADGRIGAVQFEYGRVCAMTHFLLMDFYELFEGHGFTVGEILRDRVRTGPYELKRESFKDGNFLAIHRSRTDLLSRA